MIKRVQAGDKMTITGLGLGMSKAILIASIVRDRVGDVHLVNSFTEVEDKKRPDFKVTGISIVLTTKSDLESSDIGYQHPEAQGETFSRFQAERESK
jgi:DNA-binding protein